MPERHRTNIPATLKHRLSEPRIRKSKKQPRKCSSTHTVEDQEITEALETKPQQLRADFGESPREARRNADHQTFLLAELVLLGLIECGDGYESLTIKYDVLVALSEGFSAGRRECEFLQDRAEQLMELVCEN